MTRSELGNELDAILRELGFTRRKTTWNRRSGEFIDVIDLQLSKSGDMTTMNVGVTHTGVYQKTWGKAPPTFVDEASSTVRSRIGQLVDGTDLWWPFSNPPAREQLDALCRRFVMPFLERMHSVETMEHQLITEQADRHLYPLPKIHLALLRFERGDGVAACALLSELRSTTSGSWRNRVNEVASRIACRLEAP